MNKPVIDKEEWEIQRINLAEILQKFPNAYMNVIDSAYLAGLESAASQSKSMIEEIKEWYEAAKKGGLTHREAFIYDKVLSILTKDNE